MLAFLGSALAALFSTGVVKFLALKIVLYGLVVTILPAVLNNVFKKIIDGMISLSSSSITGGDIPSMLVSFTGVAAALMETTGLPAAFSVVLAALAFKVSLRLIPFIRL